LGCRRNPNWKFLAIESNCSSFEFAQENVARNALEDRIELFCSDMDSKELIPRASLSQNNYDFLMCNPPFYRSKSHIESCKDIKATTAKSVCTGNTHEMITNGGEVQFIKQIVFESLVLRDRIQIYTTLVGIKKDLSEIEDFLSNLDDDILEYNSKAFQQGHTRRWILSWKVSPILRKKVKLAK
jgi:23S rRNA A1618 N6-methylase RlmF